ncbi:MAG: hypothetical protein LBI87_03830 [Candidatus Accumulibacter sp.]|jgi:hypothetical protein|nr:hypothetical protein [Accumulibacter sp.]
MDFFLAQVGMLPAQAADFGIHPGGPLAASPPVRRAALAGEGGNIAALASKPRLPVEQRPAADPEGIEGGLEAMFAPERQNAAVPLGFGFFLHPPA